MAHMAKVKYTVNLKKDSAAVKRVLEGTTEQVSTRTVHRSSVCTLELLEGLSFIFSDLLVCFLVVRNHMGCTYNLQGAEALSRCETCH